MPGAGWHVDIIVLRIPAIEGGRYFLLFTDDCTRVWVGFVLERKSDAVDAFKRFHRDVIAFHGLPMVFLKSDRGGEFVSNRFAEILLAYGIRSFLVTPRDPQANGSAERQGQTLFGDVRCMLIDSGMSPSFWSWAARYAIYIRNRLSRARGKDGGSHNITPYEWLTGKRASLRHAHLFGAHCTYYHDPGNKLLPRGRAARFLGLEDEHKLVLWDPSSHTIVVRKHVQFRERGPSCPEETGYEAGGECEDAEGNIGVPEEEAGDLVHNFHDGSLDEADEEYEPTRPVPGAKALREFDALDQHLENIPDSSEFCMEEITQRTRVGGAPYADRVPQPDEVVNADDDVTGMSASDDEEVDQDIKISPPSTVGMHHPSLLKKLDSSLAPGLTEVLGPRRGVKGTVERTDERTAAHERENEDAPMEKKKRGRPRKKKPAKPPVVGARRGPGRPRKVPVAAAMAEGGGASALPDDGKPVHTNGRGRRSQRKDRKAGGAVDTVPPQVNMVTRAPPGSRKRARPEDRRVLVALVCGTQEMNLGEESVKEELNCVLDRFAAGAHQALSLTIPAPGGNFHTVPINYRQAHKRPDEPKWTEAEAAEIQGLINKRVFEWKLASEVPPHMKILTTRFVYDFKTNELNEILKYKARLVVRGYEQREGIEYGETFSATVRAASIRLVLSIAARERLKLHQFDVEQAFLTADLGDEVIFVHPPEGQRRPGCVWKLRKALYGLKQASHLFQEHFSRILLDLGMERLKSDKSIYVMRRRRGNGKSVLLIACVYVDDIVVAYGDAEILAEFKAGLSSKIGIKDMGPLKYCLGMLVEQHPMNYSVTITQTGFIQDLLDRTGFGGEDTRPRRTPGPQGEKLRLADCPVTESDKAIMKMAPYNQYHSIVGSLLYLTGATRPDVGFAVNQLARFVANPGRRQWDFLVHLLRYLAGTRELGVHYCGNKVQGIILEDEKTCGYWGPDAKPQPQLLSESFHNNLLAYADADWAADEDSRRSITGWVTFLNGGPVSWRVKRQAAVATSSAESELYSLGDCMKEVRWLQKLLLELGFPQPHRIPGRGGATAEPGSVKNRGTVIYEDNTGCIQISQNDVFHNRTKHVDIQWQFVLQYVAEGRVCVTHVGTKDQVADVMTKNVPGTILAQLRPRLLGTWFQRYHAVKETGELPAHLVSHR